MLTPISNIFANFLSSALKRHLLKRHLTLSKIRLEIIALQTVFPINISYTYTFRNLRLALLDFSRIIFKSVTCVFHWVGWCAPLASQTSGIYKTYTYSETGRIRFRRARFQTPSSVSFSGLAEFRGANSVSSFQPIICVQTRTHRVFSQNSPSWPQHSVRLSEFSSPKQYSRNSIPPVS